MAWLCGSLALITGAGHMLTDAASLLLALAVLRFSQKKADHYTTPLAGSQRPSTQSQLLE
ncbi:cation transporter [Ferrimonas pelagia]|uniref:cation transporter n=1 Tax=Ferrimonas pelagia TaxID=1177826 RepID=UPI003CD0BFED